MHVDIYTKEDCQYCFQAKRLLVMNNIQYNEKKLDVDFTREFLTEKFIGVKSYPVIVIDGMNIGGYNSLKALVEQRNKTSQVFLTEG